MKIGEVARLSNLSVATLRYYVNSGLIVPKLKNTKFDFTADDLKDVQIIASLKKMGFSINEMHRIISLKRVSNWVETEDLLDYIRIMVKKREELKDRIVETQNQITMLDHEIETTNRQIVVVRKPTGVPTRAIEHLCCPHCRLPLQLNEARMNYQYIFSGKLECECGYTAEIKNGVIITNGPEISRYDKPDINRTIYKEMPGDLVTYFQKAYNWLLPKLPSANSDGNVIMETHLNSFFFLYKHFETLSSKNLYIISDKFSEIIDMYKSNIERLGLDLNIIYIVNNDNLLPLKDGIVDYFIDFCSSNEHNIFSKTLFLQEIKRYMRDKKHVLSVYFSFDEHSKSIRRLHMDYPENHPDNYKLRLFRKSYQDGYRLVEHTRVGTARDSGKGIAFIFHQNDENMYIDCFDLEKSPGTHP